MQRSTSTEASNLAILTCAAQDDGVAPIFNNLLQKSTSECQKLTMLVVTAHCLIFQWANQLRLIETG